MTQNAQSKALSVCICSRKAAGISRNPGVFCLKNSEQGIPAMREMKLERFGSKKKQKAGFPWRNCLCWALLEAFSACWVMGVEIRGVGENQREENWSWWKSWVLFVCNSDLCDPKFSPVFSWHPRGVLQLQSLFCCFVTVLTLPPALLGWVCTFPPVQALPCLFSCGFFWSLAVVSEGLSPAVPPQGPPVPVLCRGFSHSPQSPQGVSTGG